MQESYETLLLKRPQDHVLQITINRPERRNAMNTQLGRDMLDIFSTFLLDPGDTRTVIITGAGDKAFCAGGDLKERDGMTDEEWRLQHVIFEQAIYHVIDCPVPVIAAVNGSAFGGGCEMALAADFIYATESARFALTEVTLGIIPGCGGTQNLPRAAGSRRAKEILYTGSPFTAAEGLEWGIINKITPHDELMETTLDLAQRIADGPTYSQALIKRLVQRSLNIDFAESLRLAGPAQTIARSTDDHKEGVRAFVEKRQPAFKGR